MTDHLQTGGAPLPMKKVAPVERETTVTLYNREGDSLVLTEEEARAIYSQLRKWYGRSK